MRHALVGLLVLLTSCGNKAPDAAQPESGPATVATSVAFLEGPAEGPDGWIYFTDVMNDRILKHNPGSKQFEVFRTDANRANGLIFDGKGRLIACEGSDEKRNTPRLTRTDLQTGQVEVLAERFEGKSLQGPNDVTLDARGRIYFTDPIPGLASQFLPKPEKPTGTPGVYRIDLDGKLVRLLSAPETAWPNGLVISPDDRVFYLIEADKSQGGARAIYAFDLSPEGTLNGKRVFYNFSPGRSADGMAIDEAGNIYAAAGLHQRRGTAETLDTKCGVHVISPLGKLLRFIPIPEDLITNTAFGGKDRKTLFITAGKSLFQVPNELAGLNR